MTDETMSEDYGEIRAAVRALCAGFPGEYWRAKDKADAYPTEFVEALTEAGYLAALIPEEVALKHTVVPVNRAGSTLIIATGDPSNIFALDDIKFLTGYNTEVVVATEQAIHAAIDRYYASADVGMTYLEPRSALAIRTARRGFEAWGRLRPRRAQAPADY